MSTTYNLSAPGALWSVMLCRKGHRFEVQGDATLAKCPQCASVATRCNRYIKVDDGLSSYRPTHTS